MKLTDIFEIIFFLFGVFAVVSGLINNNALIFAQGTFLLMIVLTFEIQKIKNRLENLEYEKQNKE